MRDLTPDDLLPLEEYVERRRELFEAQARYLDRHRRVRIGPLLTLVFENRQTLWFRIHEILRVARLTEPVRVQQELDLYNRLLPHARLLQAALRLNIRDDKQGLQELQQWRTLQGDKLQFILGQRAYPANLLTCRPEDRCIGTAHWVQFPLDGDACDALGDARQPAYFQVALDHYRHDSSPLSVDVRQSLLDDLRLAERAA